MKTIKKSASKNVFDSLSVMESKLNELKFNLIRLKQKSRDFQNKTLDIGNEF
ncbi:hypothetical protein [Flexithrix dorotheae]|uniref:hypothetical protein n=1 Tax=Flexithrix dorotheae TaxID=70993 RepID=UPI00036AEE73|nr:hypothetical protein [Flexithrix dorotheae]